MNLHIHAKKFAMAASAALMVLGCGTTDGPTADEQKLLDEAKDLFADGKAFLEAGEYELARGKFKEIIKETEDPDDTEYADTLKKYDKEKLMSKARFSWVLADILYQVNNAISQLGDILGLLGDTGVLGSPSVVLTPAGRIAHYQQLAALTPRSTVCSMTSASPLPTGSASWKSSRTAGSSRSSSPNCPLTSVTLRS